MAIGQDNLDSGRGGKYTLYDFSERSADSKYPSWVDGAPNLQSYLNAINKSQPIVQCQYELVWSRWPRTMFFAKNISIPGISVNTVDLNHAGFTIKIPTHVTYETTEITLNIMADKEGFHYYDLRNMVLQTGHPLVAGDPKSTIGNPYGISPDEDTIEVRLRNKPSDETHHHWIIHNFKPIGLGDIELSQDSGSFVEFELKGTFTHITYDCGKTLPPEEPVTPSQAEKQQEAQPQANQAAGDTRNDTPSEDGDEDNWDDQDEWSDEDWEEQEEMEEGSEDSDEEEEATLDDEDERSAYEMLKENGDKSDEELLSDLKDKFSQENPNEDPELIETRAEFALDAAKKYQQQHPNERRVLLSSRDTVTGEVRPRLVICKNKCGWVGTEFGQTNETLTRAVRFNHEISDIKSKVFINSVEQELNDYSCKISKLTLPQRFGLYRTPAKDTPKITEVELEDPPFNPDSTSSRLARNPNHKVRGIFD